MYANLSRNDANIKSIIEIANLSFLVKESPQNEVFHLKFANVLVGIFLSREKFPES